MQTFLENQKLIKLTLFPPVIYSSFILFIISLRYIAQ